MKRILIIPSWYATPEAPTSGSFFREQALLMEDFSVGNVDFKVQVLTTEKFWISGQRHAYYQLFPRKVVHSDYAHFLPEMDGRVVVYPFCKFASEQENLQREIAAVIAYFERNSSQLPDVIHAHCTFVGGILARALSKHFSIPYIITEHMNPFLLDGYSEYFKDLIRLSLQEAHAVLAVSEHQRQHILMHSIACNPITVGNLVDDAAFTISSTPKKSASTHFLIVTYYPNFIKDMGTFFEALCLLKDQNALEGRHFTIVGGGELQGAYHSNYYTEQIAKFDLQAHVTVVPSATRSEMVDLLQGSDCLISTSIAETFGVAICEAMLCGKPVIITENGGSRDYATSDNSIVVPIRDAAALTRAIMQFDVHQFDAQTIRSSIVGKYGRRAFRQRMEAIYLDVLSNFQSR